MPDRRRLLASSLFLPLIAGVPGRTQSAPQTFSAEQLRARMTSEMQQVRSTTSLLPRVDVTHASFGDGCPNPADPSGSRDSTCAINHAADFARSNPASGGGYPVLYFPHGRYLVAGQGFQAALTFNVGIGMVGDGAQSSTIVNTSPSAGTVAYNKATECAGKPGPCFIRIAGLTFAGQGHTTMGGLVEINSTNTGLMEDVVLAETGGIALNLQGSSERWSFSQIEIEHARWSVLTEGDTNEDYFYRVNVMSPGEDASHFCWSVNCPGGHLAQGGTWYPDPHSAVFLDGDNVHWLDSSIKSTAVMGGMRMAPTTSSVAHTYFEGLPWGGQPRTSHSIALGGKLELGHTTQAISASELTIPVDDAGWQPLYTNDPALAHYNGEHAYTPVYRIFPADYLAGSREPSTAVRGITRGTYESVRVASFAGDGRAHLLARAQERSAAVAWPAGSIIEQSPPRSYGMARAEENHFNSINFDGMARFSSGCDDTAMLTRWTSNPSRLCAEVILGLVPDGYGVPIPQAGSMASPFSLELAGNSIYTGSNEQGGQGWIKIAANGNLHLDQDDPPLTRFAAAETALNTYVNGSRVQIITWSGVSALAVVHDESANVSFSPQDRYFTADIVNGGTLGHQYLGEQCWYPIQPGGRQPDSRFCVRAGGAASEKLVGGRWVAK